MERNSFVLYRDFCLLFDLLDMKERGELITALFGYALDGQEPKDLDATTEMAFVAMKNQIKRDGEKYSEKCAKARINGAKGGRPRANSTENEKDNAKKVSGNKSEVFAKEPCGNEKNQRVLSQSYNGNDNEDVNVNEYVNDTVYEDEDVNVNDAESCDLPFACFSEAPPCTYDTPSDRPRTQKKENCEKRCFLTCVYLTDAQYESLKTVYGTEDTDELIRILEQYKLTTGKKYDSDYAAITSWCVKKLQELRSGESQCYSRRKSEFIDNPDSSMADFNFEDFLEGPGIVHQKE